MNERYMRQIPLIGKDGQLALSNARVLVVGAGGLGSSVLYYLAGAGIGSITIVDFDIVQLSNLNRQILHFEADIGKKKVFSATEKLQKFNSEISITAVDKKLDKSQFESLIQKVDIVAACVDNIKTRLLLNELCIKQNKILVDAGVDGFYGYVRVIKKGFACLACDNATKDSCPPRPSLGAVVGVIGSLQAVEIIKILLQKGDALYSKILYYDALSAEFETVLLKGECKCKF